MLVFAGAMMVATGPPGAAAAADRPDGGGLPAVDIHGFVSQGAIKSTHYNYLVNSDRGSFDFTEMGLNFTTQPTDKLRLGFQLFARRLGTTGNFSAKADWFYFDYRWRDWLGFRGGRVKLPFGLYNEINDVDAARTPILLPQSIYPLSSRDFLLAQSGGELYGYVRMGNAGALEYRLYGGAVEVDIPAQAGSPLQITAVETPYVVGGRLLWETPVEGLRVGGSAQWLRLDLNVTAAMMPFTYQIPASLWVSSVEYAAHDLLLAAEYGRWRSSAESSNDKLSPSMGNVTSERFYVLAGYRFARWFEASAYYSLLVKDADHPDGVAANQHDWALTFRFDINAHWLVKLEEHYMHNAAALDPALNGVVPADLYKLDQDWLVFLLKTTAYF